LGFAKCHYRLGQTEKAIEIFESDLKDAEENFLTDIVVSVSRQLIGIYHKIAETYENDESENIRDALFYYEKCLEVSIFLNYELIKLMFFKVAQKASDQEAEGSICYKIGLLYFKYGDFNKTIDFQNKYLQISSNNVVKIYLSQF